MIKNLKKMIKNILDSRYRDKIHKESFEKSFEKFSKLIFKKSSKYIQK